MEAYRYSRKYHDWLEARVLSCSTVQLETGKITISHVATNIQPNKKRVGRYIPASLVAGETFW